MFWGQTSIPYICNKNKEHIAENFLTVLYITACSLFLDPISRKRFQTTKISFSVDNQLTLWAERSKALASNRGFSNYSGITPLSKEHAQLIIALIDCLKGHINV